MGQQSLLPGLPSYLVVESSLFKFPEWHPRYRYEWSRERAGHFVRLINGPCVLLLETAGVCWLRILVSMKSLTRGKSSKYSFAGGDINSSICSVHSF